MKESEDIRGLQLTLGIYIAIFAMKLVIYWVSGVLALLAEAFHTLSDIFVAGFLLIAALYSRKQADADHMFGHGRAQNAAALVAATLFISFTSFELFREALPRLFSSELPTYQNLPWVIGVLLASMVIAALPLAQLSRRKTQGPAAKALFVELINDELGLLAALAGTLLILGGQPIADPIVSLIVATIIAYNGIRLLIENLSCLMGHSPGSAYLAEIKRLALSVPGVVGIRDLRAEYIGPDMVRAGIHLEIERGKSLEDADRIAKQIHDRIHEKKEPSYCLIQVEPARSGDSANDTVSQKSVDKV